MAPGDATRCGWLANPRDALTPAPRLRHSETSRLFGRLNSYARQHPLYRALKELGRLVKIEFLLRYIDQVELRQRLQKQFNKGESAYRLALAVWHGHHREFHAATSSEQLVAETCKRLLMNAIICRNYLQSGPAAARVARRRAGYALALGRALIPPPEPAWRVRHRS